MTDKGQRRVESRRLAIVDLLVVSHVAGVLRRSPPDRHVALRSGDELFDDPYLTSMLEAGLIVTYARIFTRGDRYTPVPRRWVPSEHDDLHGELMDRRHRYHAHTDLASSNPHRRNAADAGGEWFMVGQPDRYRRN